MGSIAAMKKGVLATVTSRSVNKPISGSLKELKDALLIKVLLSRYELVPNDQWYSFRYGSHVGAAAVSEDLHDHAQFVGK